MKICKCISSDDYSLKRNEYYYYTIEYTYSEIVVNEYPYLIFSMKDGNELLNVYNETMFKKVFIDNQELRKQKIQKLNEL